MSALKRGTLLCFTLFLPPIHALTAFPWVNDITLISSRTVALLHTNARQLLSPHHETLQKEGSNSSDLIHL
ncbi:uncharacterized protein BKA55DRAFT_575129 [Fusarium redolens]|uniref:Uncharacterized protein n=1 Tax=Fusarium redolens TaxID=48865 RepID=A0A9P9GQD5_FUSRE|nr:uncharacterized protein BKA55DRAFT_575129 [Fusarium redolens]KAH7243580.1 hypothetical protein BKA55DRAFT_575129 [Fusarium redolens]